MGVKVRRKGKRWGVFIAHKGKRKALIRWDSKREAEAVAVRIRRDLGLADLGLNQSGEKLPTFAERAEAWYRIAVGGADGLAPTTARNYRRHLDNYLLPVFGSKPITEVSRQDIREFAKDNLGRISFGHLNNVLNPLRLTLQEAVEDGLLPSNPGHKLNLRMRTKKKRERDLNPLNLSEMSLLLETIRSHQDLVDNYPFILTAAHTGMRFGELRALRWSDIQFGKDDKNHKRYITVQRSYNRGYFSTPKSGRSRRVDLSAILRRVLMDHQVGEFTKGQGKPDGLVFYGKEGGPVGEGTCQRSLKKASAHAELREVTFHSIRHSYATILLYEMGAPIQYVSHQLGHASIKVTVDVYGHPDQGTNIALADGFSEQLSATYPQLIESEVTQVPVL